VEATGGSEIGTTEDAIPSVELITDPPPESRAPVKEEPPPADPKVDMGPSPWLDFPPFAPQMPARSRAPEPAAEPPLPNPSLEPTAAPASVSELLLPTVDLSPFAPPLPRPPKPAPEETLQAMVEVSNARLSPGDAYTTGEDAGAPETEPPRLAPVPIAATSVTSSPAPATVAAPATQASSNPGSDPLAALKALSEIERIALFT
jgi:hypothetical protein